jgi:NhaP-type Na+/H+ or K+/H+ antiporter
MSGSAVIPVSLFVFLSLFIGIVFRKIVSYVKFPYTPLILIIGLLWGLLIEYLGVLGDSGEAWSSVDPHTILIIFIPALIYESAFGTDVHMFRREILSILLLAVPGVVISTILTAITAMYILDYSDTFGWSEALMFGAILSATDPVAVVALLKELGASKRLGTLIEGESLLNDGTAMVVFEVFYNLAKGEDMGIGDVVELFFQLSFGGLLLGLAFAIIMTEFAKRVYGDPIAEVMITFVTVYITFWTAEGSGAHVSGILALVALGLYMSAWGKSLFSSMSEETLHHFWMIVAWSAETVLFVLSGVIIGYEAIGQSKIQGADWGKLFALFVCVIIIRGLSSISFYPIMRKVAYGLSWSQYFVMIWGGLRGAIGLALALIVYHDHDIESDVRNLVLFHTAGIVVFTLLINGTTTGWFLKKFGLVRSSHAQERLLMSVIETIQEETEEQVKVLKDSNHL